jgi:RNA polymerase sigma factor (sigma-70 family)
VDEHLVLLDDQRDVLVALRSLPTRQRECLVLRYYLDLTESQIAATLGISNGSVKSHSSRGIAALAHRLEGRR